MRRDGRTLGVLGVRIVNFAAVAALIVRIGRSLPDRDSAGILGVTYSSVPICFPFQIVDVSITVTIMPSLAV
jgi:hypothetical protein